MVTDEQEKHIQEANQKVLNFVVQLLQAYNPMIVAGVLTSTGLGVYRSCLTDQEYKDMGFRSCVCGSIDIDLKPLIDRKVLRFMGNASAYSFLAAKDSLNDAGLNE